VRPAVRWTIGAVVLTFLVALGTVAATLVSRAQLEALSYNKSQLTRFVSVADAALNRAFFSIDVLLTSTDDLLDLSSSMVAWSRGDAASALLNGIMRQNLLVRSVALLDSQGKVLASSDPAGAQWPLQLPAGLLPRVLAPAMSALVVSAPAVSASSAEQVLYFARYFRMPDGTQLVAVA